MTTQEQYIERLKEMVTTRYGGGIASAEDCRALCEAVHNETDVELEWLAIAQLFIYKGGGGIAPRPRTLSTLARYVGYGSWSDFCSSREVVPADDIDIIPTTRRWGVIILTALAIVIVVVTATILLFDSKTQPYVFPERYAPIMDKWRAATTEFCNEVRANYDDTTYLGEQITRYLDALPKGVERDMNAIKGEMTSSHTTEHKQATEHIVTTCEQMCEWLRREATGRIE